ncbi:CsgE family curli-type amyloid fiber assembly protein [Burkholderia sp. L27(2015)]|uniref:CsgE family curli-type amyloid fiber assembly protein n=1 Tax=Burkholderia sp. L27(2015) TaxID=1641858 RepID=UPI00131B4CF2|nr:CsgE family curli-type amyloid fiber assembly protein [Burkholderia sp. L27(2015)]
MNTCVASLQFDRRNAAATKDVASRQLHPPQPLPTGSRTLSIARLLIAALSTLAAWPASAGDLAADAQPAQSPLLTLPSSPVPPSAKPVPNATATLNPTSTLRAPAATTVSHGSRSTDITGKHALDEMLGGIVTNQTMTLVGEDFYTSFAQAWRDMPLGDRYVVSIHERPSARWGSLIWVEFEQRRVFDTFLPAARANVASVAVRAASTAYQNVVQADIARLLFHDVDLAGDEF